MNPAEHPAVNGLKVAARARTDAALGKVTEEVRCMRKEGIAVTFRAVHRRSGVSLDFLYSNAEARRLIEHARQTVSPRTTAPARAREGTVEQVLATRLRAQETKHRVELAALQAELMALRGEVIQLRKQLDLRDRMGGSA